MEIKGKVARLFTLPFFPVIAAPFLLYAWPLLTGRTLFWGLPVLQFIPWQAYAWQQLSQGLLPLWNPLNGMGAPLLANYQLALFYPPTWLSYLFAAIGGTPAMAWAQTLLIPLHLAWAGIGMALLIRRLGLGELSQAVSGLALGLGGYFVARSGFYTMIWAGAWLPWILLTTSSFAVPVEGLPVRKRIIFPTLVICIALQLLAGHAQLSWYTLTLAAVWTVVGGWVAGKWRGSFQALGILAVNAAFGVAVAAVQLLPTAEYLLQSQRSSAVDYESGLTYSFWPWRFLTLLAPNLFGNPGTGDYWGYASFWEDAIYLGILPLGLALWTLIYFGRKGKSDPYRPLIFIGWGVILVGALFALGKNTPVFPFLYHFIPTFSLFNGPARWMIWVVFSVSLLAGIGTAHWARPTGKIRRRLKRLTVAAAAITLGAGAAWIVMREVQITFISSTALLGVWITGACILTLNMPSEAGSAAYRRWQAVVILWLATDLLAAGWSLSPTLPANYFNDAVPILSFTPVTQGRVYLNGQDEYALKFKRFFRFSDYSAIEDWTDLRQAGLPDLNLLPGSQFSMTNNFDPIVPGRFSHWMDWVDHLPSAQQARALELMNVGMVVRRDVTVTEGVSRQTVEGLARFRWLTCPQWVTSEDSSWQWIQQAVSSDADPAKLFVVEGIGPKSSPDCQAELPAQINLQIDLPGKITLQVNAQEDGFLTIADSWYPGWSATVDGSPASILRTNYLFQSVPIAAGSHTLELTYAPFSFKAGAGITLAGILFLILTSLTDRHRVK